MRKLYIVYNGASPTTAAQALFAIPAAITTMLQVATPASTPILPIAWGFSLDAPASAGKVTMELIQTDVAATGGASLTPTLYGDPNAPASLCVGGTGATMFNDGAITEGSIAATRVFESLVIVPPFVYSTQLPLGREMEVPVSKFLRIRATPTVTLNGISWVAWEE